MDFGSYGTDEDALVKLDPRTKLLILLTSGAISINSFRVEAMLAYGLFLCVTLALCGKPWFALKSFAALALMAFVRYEIETSVVASGVFAQVTHSLISIIAFAFPFVLALVLVVQTTRISQFLAALQRMHLPEAAIIPVAVLFRFIPTVRDEWDGISKAMAFRGIRLTPSSIVASPFRAIEYALIPLLFSSMSVMEELSAASLARGLDSKCTRTSYEQVRLRAADYVFMAIVAVFLVMIVVGW